MTNGRNFRFRARIAHETFYRQMRKRQRKRRTPEKWSSGEEAPQVKESAHRESAAAKESGGRRDYQRKRAAEVPQTEKGPRKRDPLMT